VSHSGSTTTTTATTTTATTFCLLLTQPFLQRFLKKKKNSFGVEISNEKVAAMQWKERAGCPISFNP